jgi:hypothetical protein
MLADHQAVPAADFDRVERLILESSVDRFSAFETPHERQR